MADLDVNPDKAVQFVRQLAKLLSTLMQEAPEEQ